jgi:hypothetical protein
MPQAHTTDPSQRKESGQNKVRGAAEVDKPDPTTVANLVLAHRPCSGTHTAWHAAQELTKDMDLDKESRSQDLPIWRQLHA